MSVRPDPEETAHHLELEQRVRAHVAQLSAGTGLREPVIEVVPFLKVRPPRINAQAHMRAGVPTITITERTVQELSYYVLRFLLAHELGHFDSWDLRQQAQRKFWKAFLPGGVIGVLGVALAATGIGASIPGFLMLAIGALMCGGALLMLQARGRVDEHRSDAFAARLTADLAAARGYFDVLSNDQPERRWDAAGLWSGHPSLRDRLAIVEGILDRDNAHGRTS